MELPSTYVKLPHGAGGDSNRSQGKDHPSILNRLATPKRRKESLEETYKWTMQTLTILSYCLNVLSNSVISWDQFKAPDGDINYFADAQMPQSESIHRSALSLWAIQHLYNQLEGHKRELLALKEACSVSLKDVSSQFI